MRRHIIYPLAATLGLLMLISGCATIAPPATDVPATAPSAASGTSVSGLATYAGTPLPGARLELRAADWRTDPSAVVASAVADADGRFAIVDAPAGDWVLVGVFADGEDDAGGYVPVVLADGQQIADVPVSLQRALTLTEPADGAETGTAPAFRWAAFADAAEYRLWVIDAGTTELLVSETTAAAEFTPTEPLPAGRTYDWEVTAYDGAGVEVASGTGRFSVVP